VYEPHYLATITAWAELTGWMLLETLGILFFGGIVAWGVWQLWRK